ncbi:hypothetical protein PHYSODRAFT_306878 [Phytophthora sojae]|uniref:Uncharacterized protein n=1 Tax=Phytophthora sojae (strain P6497) TaxID=1094619 RepID=G5ABG5_PHYSP|nr:hypothetical protein PHYSODRAFT_306878 [Phytophthora sojae]EGZ06690.1 hypothetical protein PHYSODRAFT_306878 [Phytophthora sojae]|eukprot:XP_009537454.1 hypothetical protein PHYSODRAFT_306878 [Phytophthora sojae]
MAKTNNPVENFNRQLKNLHPLRRLLRLNPLFVELLDAGRVQSVLTVRFAESPRAAPHFVRDYRKLTSNKLLSVTEVTRGAISFITSGSDFKVFQQVVRVTSPPTKPPSKVEIGADTDRKLEAELQTVFGWDVKLEAGRCSCRTMFKLGCYAFDGGSSA